MKNRDFSYLNYPLPPDILRLRESGDLTGAIRLIDQTLETNTLPELAARLRCERVRLERLPHNFPYDLETAKAMMREEWTDMTDQDFQTLMDNRRVDWRYIDGVPHFVGSFLSSARIYAKETPGLVHTADDNTKRDEMLARMKAEGGLAARITLRATIKAQEPSAGKSVQAWLPIPSQRHQQSQVEFLEYTPGGIIAPDDAPQRTIYWDSRERDEFSVTYRYLIRAPYVDVSKLVPDETQPEFCLGEEAPHIVFTPYLRDLTARVTAGCENSLEKAKAVYDYVTGEIDYRYQPDYFQLGPIAELIAVQKRGDCGMMAVLFITMCRIAGVPAQWQSGLSVHEDDAGCHDWAMFYVAPYGWLWADPSFGSSARRNGEVERRAHYFGNLDPCRMAANHQFFAPLTPPDPEWRHDPTDNQLGEMVVDGKGLFSPEMDRDVETVAFEFLPFEG